MLFKRNNKEKESYNKEDKIIPLYFSASNPVQRTQDPQQPQRLPQFNSPEVIAKMRHFHNDMAALQAVKCLICFERFPSISVNEIGSCKRCHNDKHMPKLSSLVQNSTSPKLDIVI